MEPSAALIVDPAGQPAEAAAQKKQASQNCEASINPEKSDLSSDTSQDRSPRKDRSEEELDEDAEDETVAGTHASKGQRQLAAPNRQTSPFDVRFSQMRARTEFRDGRLVEEAVAAIKAVPCPDEDGEKRVWRLEAPFPPIEVLQYRCKLRDEDGRPKLDSETGGEMWDADDHLFTLDNRRLYCYQKAAAALWPDKVVIDVIELPPLSLTRMRQVRKFRTMDSGESVLLGARNDEESLTRWSWREAVGIGSTQKKRSESGQESCYVKMRRRPRGEPRNGRPQRKNAPEDSASGKQALADNTFAKRVITFLILYLLLRLGKNAISAHFAGSDAVSEQKFFAYGIETGRLPNNGGILDKGYTVVPEHFKASAPEPQDAGHASEENASAAGVCANATHLCDGFISAAAFGSSAWKPDTLRSYTDL